MDTPPLNFNLLIKAVSLNTFKNELHETNFHLKFQNIFSSGHYFGFQLIFRATKKKVKYIFSLSFTITHVFS